MAAVNGNGGLANIGEDTKEQKWGRWERGGTAGQAVKWAASVEYNMEAPTALKHRGTLIHQSHLEGFQPK